MTDIDALCWWVEDLAKGKKRKGQPGYVPGRDKNGRLIWVPEGDARAVLNPGRALPDHGAPKRPRRRAVVAAPAPAAWSSHYFPDEATEAIYNLTQLDGAQRKEALGITVKHFGDANTSREWRDRLARLIHPDRNPHPHAAQAMARLNEIYNRMAEIPRERERKAAAKGARKKRRDAGVEMNETHPGSGVYTGRF